MALALALNLQEVGDTEFSMDTHVEPIKRCVLGLKLIGSWRADFYMALDAPFAQKMICSSRSLVSLIGQSDLTEEIRALMSAANRAPPFVDDHGLDVTLNGSFLWAAQMAHLSDGVMFTISTSPTWQSDEFKICISSLTEVGEVDVHAATLANIYDEKSSRHHRLILESKGTAMPPSGAGGIWAARREIFPGLRFLSRVEHQMSELSMNELEQVYSKLLLLNRSASEWRTGEVDYPRWRTKVTNESETRRDLCDFNDDLGVVNNYEAHARYTPGAGRIHFRCVDLEKLVEVAYIGEKLF